MMGGCAVSMGYFYEDNSQRMRVLAGRNLTFPLHLHMQAELVLIVEGHFRHHRGEAAAA
jgi:anti-sigma factor ChrR (cupin superfamily)